MSDPPRPSVSVVVPVRNEAANLDRAVAAVLSQDYDGELEIVLAVGPSSDGTAAVAAGLAARDSRVRCVDNPSGRTSAGLNAALSVAKGDLVARVDGHCVIPSDYLSSAVEIIVASGADVVGGIQDARGESDFEKAVAAAMTSRFGVGNAKFHYGGDPGPTDTVYLGVFRRAALEAVGGFDESLVRNQDYELNWRIRDRGGVVWFDPDLRVAYRPRATIGALALQYFEYGRWKREMLRRHPRSLRLRQLAPPLAVLSNVGALGAAVLVDRRFLSIPGMYLIACLVAARRRAPFEALSVASCFAVMHHAWGVGFLIGAPGAPEPVQLGR